MTNQPHALTQNPTRCGAKTRGGGTCQSFPVEGSKRCRMHGGTTPKGIASPHFKNGKFSKYMPAPLGELAWAAANDPELFNLRELIGVYQARIQNALAGLDTGDSFSRMEALRDAWRQFRKTTKTVNAAAYYQAIDDVERLLELAMHDIYLWKDIDVAADNLKKLSESERKRQVEMHMLIPTNKATDFALQLVLAVRAEITDAATLQRIQQRVTDVLGGYPAVVALDESERE